MSFASRHQLHPYFAYNYSVKSNENQLKSKRFDAVYKHGV